VVGGRHVPLDLDVRTHIYAFDPPDALGTPPAGMPLMVTPRPAVLRCTKRDAPAMAVLRVLFAKRHSEYSPWLEHGSGTSVLGDRPWLPVCGRQCANQGQHSGQCM